MGTKTILAREGKEVGSAIFYAAPVHHDHDYSCSPSGLLTFLQAKCIAEHLAEGKDDGWVGIYEWWESE